MAIAGVLGETLRTSIHHYDADGFPILGASFAVVESDRPDGSAFTAVFNEIGNGMYEAVVATSVSDAPGEWFLLVEADNGTRYEEVFDLQGYRQPTVTFQSIPESGASRQEIRRAVAQMLGDLTMVVATGDGQEATVFDRINLAREANAFNAAQILCAEAQSPQNVGKTATIVSNNPGAASINITPPFPAETRAGDVFEIYNYRDNGWTVDEYNRAINDAILRGGETHATLPHSEVIEAPYSRTTNTVVIPRSFSHFSGIDIVQRHGGYKAVPKRYYEVDRHLREVTLKGPYLYKAHGMKVRLRGHRKPEKLLTDDSRTSIASEWLVHEAAAVLIQGDTTSGFTQGSRDRLMGFERNSADGRRTSILTTYAPNTVRLEG